MRFATLLLVMALASTAACSNPCDDFAALTCQTVGADSAECARARSYAKHAPSEEQKICAQALELAKTLKRR